MGEELPALSASRRHNAGRRGIPTPEPTLTPPAKPPRPTTGSSAALSITSKNLKSMGTSALSSAVVTTSDPNDLHTIDDS